VISLLKKVLAIEPADRITLDKLQAHLWCQADLSENASLAETGTDCVDAEDRLPPTKRHCPDPDNPTGSRDSLSRMCLSQPMPSISCNVTAPADTDDNHENRGFCFSQPTLLDDMLLCTQMSTTQCANPFQRLVKRMTRFFVTCDRFDDALRKLIACLDQLGYKCKIQDDNTSVVIMTTDRRKMDLIYRANLIEMDGKILLDFRLSRGCGLDFKRSFMRIKEALKQIICPGPTNWPNVGGTVSMC